MTATIFPLTVGLLVSIALRMNHAFAMPDMGCFQIELRPIDERQRDGLYLAYCLYGKEVSGTLAKSSDITERQAREEIVGEGFYSPDKEDSYVGLATPASLLYAASLVDGFYRE